MSDMSRMESPTSRIVKRIILAISSAIIVWCAFTFLTFHGVADSETVEILQTRLASQNRVAMLIRRSDHTALSGNTYFVFIGDHLYSVPELRKTLYSLHPVFMVGLDGFVLQWANPNELMIECQDCGITKDIIEKQDFVYNGIAIRYIKFP